MVRLRSTPLLLVAAAGLLLQGCRGQHVEGRWRGAFPLSGTHGCELRLMGDHTMTVACDGTLAVGAGRYRWDGSRLSLELSVLTRTGRRVAAPAALVFTIQGEGNVMRASLGKESYEWRRALR